MTIAIVVVSVIVSVALLLKFGADHKPVHKFGPDVDGDADAVWGDDGR